jgi:hypothetical protein
MSACTATAFVLLVQGMWVSAQWVAVLDGAFSRSSVMIGEIKQGGTQVPERIPVSIGAKRYGFTSLSCWCLKCRSCRGIDSTRCCPP